MISKKEAEVLIELRQDSRQSLSELSRKTAIHASTLRDILKRLKKRGIIDRHVSLIDFKSLGFNIKTIIFLKSENKYNLLDFIITSKHTNSIQKITHGYDYVVEGIFENLADYVYFKEALQEFSITKIKEH
ncbi:MAG: Lrp/AsnC family transcriptional regulator, partial [Nanoarchaeota archaeon]